MPSRRDPRHVADREPIPDYLLADPGRAGRIRANAARSRMRMRAAAEALALSGGADRRARRNFTENLFNFDLLGGRGSRRTVDKIHRRRAAGHQDSKSRSRRTARATRRTAASWF